MWGKRNGNSVNKGEIRDSQLFFKSLVCLREFYFCQAFNFWYGKKIQFQQFVEGEMIFEVCSCLSR